VARVVAALSQLCKKATVRIVRSFASAIFYDFKRREATASYQKLEEGPINNEDAYTVNTNPLTKVIPSI
jgi:hypothetical protein